LYASTRTPGKSQTTGVFSTCTGSVHEERRHGEYREQHGPDQFARVHGIFDLVTRRDDLK